MNKNIYLMRILLTAMIGYILGAVTVYYGQTIILLMVAAVIVTSFFVYEGMAYKKLERKETANEKERSIENWQKRCR